MVTEKVFFTDTDSAVEMGFTGQRFAHPPYNSFTADRARFDPYLAAKAVQAGARLFTEATVRELIYRRTDLTAKTASGVILDDGSRLYGIATP
ncbi:MAG: electron transfer flavoprotein-quinone oxidoreductase [Eubacteriales bacterium]|nr:electron transfer flavoprotein-quinone oxidoreductase [Eubacteriales bacterium]